MKYGLITYHKIPNGRENNVNANDKGVINIGDYIQEIAIRRFYLEEMHINNNDIVEIDFHELATYNGEYLIVIINFFFFGCHDMKETWFPASPFIIPVFLGLHLSSGLLTERECSYFRRFEPIGCRDEFTLATMRRYGIDAYLFGCITSTFPKRREGGAYDTIFFVDVDDNRIAAHLPDKFRECHIERRSHVLSVFFSKESYEKARSLAVDSLDNYRDKAALVITSRLHCASPCMAMGIPTIMVVKEKSQRYSWLANFVDIYTENEIEQIDWGTHCSFFENFKSKMVEFAKQRVNAVLDKYDTITSISKCYESNPQAGYEKPFICFFNSLDKMLTENSVVYYVWGGTALAVEAIHHITNTNSSWQLGGIIDEYNSIEYNGLKSITFNALKGYAGNQKFLFIVTPTSSCGYIKKLLQESELSEYKALFPDGSVISSP